MTFKEFNTKEFEDKYAYSGTDLGVTLEENRTTFKVWAPTASKVVLKTFSKGSDQEAGCEELGTYELTAGEKGVYAVTVEKNLKGVYYTYLVTVDGETKETCDVYAKASGVNSLRSMVVDLSETNPEGWEKDKHLVIPLEETEIWEVHIGDFSNDKASGVRPEYRGKYLAFTEENTTVNGEGKFPTCVNYLKELGITHVHLLPTYDYGSIDESKETNENINWGYDPVNYNVPEGSYSTNPFDGNVRIKEFKQMVMALHKAGISVVMDVVYNHTYSLDSVFEKTVPGYYYRQDAEGNYTDGSCCGNDTASDREMYRKYMIQSVLYWANEYHIDGFRFDLMGLHDVTTMNQIRAALDEIPEVGKDMILYGEPWSAGPSGYREGTVPADKKAINLLSDRILVFNDDIRDCVKGPFNELEVPGFANGKKEKEELLRMVIPGGFSDEFEQPATPGKVINYVSAHDNSTLWDKLVDSVKKDHSYNVKDKELLAMNKLAATIVQMSKGVPFMQAGEEGARTKQGEDNSYNLGVELNKIDWQRMEEYSDLIEYYKGLMRIRKSYPEITDLTRETADRIQFIETGVEQTVAFRNNRLFVVYNASKQAMSVAVDEKYKILACDGKILDNPEIVQGSVRVSAVSALIAVMC